MKNFFRRVISTALAVCVSAACVTSFAVSAESDSGRVFGTVSKTVTTAQRNKYYSDSAFIGSSIGVGQQNYFKSMGNGYLGNPKFMVKGCYSFNNDFTNNRAYMISYNGVTYHAEDAIKASGVKKVFINMGTNDMVKPAAGVFEDYKKYLRRIRAKNPDVIIFIESTTPRVGGSGNLTNSNINALNALMKQYCSEHRDLYFIDVSTTLKNSSGALRSDYSSDGYVHLTYSGYAAWMKQVTKFTDKLMVRERYAKAAANKLEKLVKQGKYEKAKKYYPTAKKYWSKLEKSTVKSELTARLKAAKAKIKKNT